MYIRMIKKILQDGSPCRKCKEIEDRLVQGHLIDRIDEIIIADERDQDSPGMKLAEQYKVDRAPFFIVEKEGEPAQIYTVYFRFIKEVFNSETSEQEEIKEILDQSPDLDYI